MSGAGIPGISTAWHLLGHGHGHEVTVVDRRRDAALHVGRRVTVRLHHQAA